MNVTKGMKPKFILILKMLEMYSEEWITIFFLEYKISQNNCMFALN
jgi:hypothetical protein